MPTPNEPKTISLVGVQQQKTKIPRFQLPDYKKKKINGVLAKKKKKKPGASRKKKNPTQLLRSSLPPPMHTQRRKKKSSSEAFPMVWILVKYLAELGQDAKSLVNRPNSRVKLLHVNMVQQRSTNLKKIFFLFLEGWRLRERENKVQALPPLQKKKLLKKKAIKLSIKRINVCV